MAYRLREDRLMKRFATFIAERQDPDIKDRSGTQPAKYYAGDMAKSTKVSRDRQFKKQTKMSDKDPAAYKPAPGDDVETKPSQYTKKYQKMFEEAGQITHGSYQTKHFDMCPGAVALYKDMEVTDLSMRSVKLQDSLFQMEKEVVQNKTATTDDVEAAQNVADEIMKLAKMMGLEKEHNYIQGHIDVIRDLVPRKEYKKMFSEAKIASVEKKAKETGIAYGILKKVYDRGMAAWKSGHRPGTNPHQWALARINSFATGGKTRTTADADLWKQVSKKAK